VRILRRKIKQNRNCIVIEKNNNANGWHFAILCFFNQSNRKATSNLRYISRDTESHIGGVWKAADSVKNLGSKATRSGTYSRWLDIRMGD
jgi:hypothetical protein